MSAELTDIMHLRAWPRKVTEDHPTPRTGPTGNKDTRPVEDERDDGAGWKTAEQTMAPPALRAELCHL